MACQFIKAALACGDTSMPDAEHICHNIYRWEIGRCSPRERYIFYYCHVFGIPRSEFGGGKAEDEVSAGCLAMTSVGLMAGMLGLRYEFNGETLTIRRGEGVMINTQPGIENAVNLICSILKSGAGLSLVTSQSRTG
jgi:hypothetical protein